MSTNNEILTCATCGETAHRDNADEMVFMNGDDIIHSISEQYPDWTHCICGECYDKKIEEMEIPFDLEAARVDYEMREKEEAFFQFTTKVTEIIEQSGMFSEMKKYEDMTVDEQRAFLSSQIERITKFKADLIRFAEEHPEDQTAYDRVQTQQDTLDYFETMLRVLEAG